MADKKSTRITPESVENAKEESTQEAGAETAVEETAKKESKPAKKESPKKTVTKEPAEKPAKKITSDTAKSEENEGEEEQTEDIVEEKPFFSEAHINSLASSREQDVLRELNKQPKVRIRLALEKGEKVGVAYVPVTINGLRFEIMKGKARSVPQQIAELVEGSDEATEEALQQFNVNREEINEETGKPRDFSRALRL